MEWAPHSTRQRILVWECLTLRQNQCWLQWLAQLSLAYLKLALIARTDLLTYATYSFSVNMMTASCTLIISSESCHIEKCFGIRVAYWTQALIARTDLPMHATLATHDGSFSEKDYDSILHTRHLSTREAPGCSTPCHIAIFFPSGAVSGALPDRQPRDSFFLVPWCNRG